MKKGFTLIELLVVIAIIAVLATAVVLVLNPAELLKQGRDSTRISDLAALNSAISLWVSDVIPATNWSSAAGLRCTNLATHPNPFSGAALCTINASTTVDGTGWVALDFRLIAAGSPLSRLPTDPNNGASTCNKGSPAVCEYAINVSSTVGVYKLATQMESTKFNTGGGSDVTSKDGGTDANWYEVGSDMSL
jgi:prepilin-type N-terminal cleavage/methylation domain-containing protein